MSATKTRDRQDQGGHWSILAKVMAAPLVMLIALSALSIVGWQTIRVQGELMSVGFAQIDPLLRHAYGVPYRLAQVEADLYKLSIWGRIGVRGYELDRTVRAIENNLERTRRDIGVIEDTDLANAGELRNAFFDYRYHTMQTLMLIERNATLGAVAVRSGHQTYSQTKQLATELAAQAFERFTAQARRARAITYELTRDFAIIAGIAGLCAIVIGFAAARRIVRPIEQIVRATQSLLRGDLSITVPHVERRDELGRIAVSVNELQRVLVQNRDLAEAQRERQAELEFFATHDALTGIANRKGFDTDLQTRLHGPHRKSDNVIFVLIDLDGFKPVNDTYGHDAGDAALATIASRLKNLVRSSDLVARIGGDEFAILLDGDDGTAQLEDLAKRLYDTISVPITHEGRTFSVGASFGIVRRGDVDGDEAAFLSAADQAMYEAKKQLNTSFHIHRPCRDVLENSKRERTHLVNALSADDFIVHYQPKWDLLTDRPIGYEALPRWRRSDSETLLPGAFMPLLERHGLKSAFYLAIARRVFADMTTLAGLNAPRIDMSFNIDDTMIASKTDVSALSEIIRSHQSLADQITIETPETLFLSRAGEHICTHMARLHRLGPRICIDRIGSGYASIRDFRQYPFQQIKIDQSFVSPIGQDRSTEVIVEGLLSIAKGLGVEVVAEGVENEAQEQYLLKRGCHICQGARYGEAQPLETVIAQLLAPPQSTEKVS